MKSTRPLNLALLAFNAALIVAAAHWVGCATPARETYHEPTEPGFYNITGWGGAYVNFADRNSAGTGSDIDSDGTVGHPYYLGSPTALAIPTHHWSSTNRVISGSLPPGLTMESNGDIKGIPTERGHWIVTLSCADMQTNGVNYWGFTQQVRIHITGSGEVNQ